MMGSTYNLRLVSYFIYGTIIHIFLVAPVQTTSVHLGPAEGFRQFSDVIFPGELFTLQCVWDGLTTCNISMSFNDISIYEEGGFQSQDSGFTNSRSLNCSLNIQINNVNVQHKGIYKCRVQNGDKTMEDTYELNVVTESPQCLTKFNEYENSFQLLCYTFSPTGSYVPQTWEIFELGVGSTTFTEFAIKYGPSKVKRVGVSNENIKEQNLTGQYKCSYSLEASKSCIFNLNCSRGIDISESSTIVPPTRLNRSMSTLRHTSPPPDTSKQPAKKPTWIVIIVVTAATVLLIACASLTVITYKMNNNFSGRVNKKENTAQVGNDLAQTAVVFSRSSDTANSESSIYQEIQENRTDNNHVPHSMRNEGELPEEISMYREQRGVRYQENQLSDGRLKPYLTVSIDDIDQSIIEGTNCQNDSSINNTDMVDCSVYEPFEGEKTE